MITIKTSIETNDFFKSIFTTAKFNWNTKLWEVAETEKNKAKVDKYNEALKHLETLLDDAEPIDKKAIQNFWKECSKVISLDNFEMLKSVTFNYRHPRLNFALCGQDFKVISIA